MTHTIYSEYPKLKNLHKRDPADNKVIDEFTDEIFSPEQLGNAGWTWREKMDGTNLRIIWDGHRAEYRGRTDRAQFSDGQTMFLDEKIKSPAFEELLEQTFGNTEAVLFGELIGNKLQGNPHKVDGYEIRVYDAFVAGWWLLPASVDELASDLGLGSAEIIVVAPIGHMHRVMKNIASITEAFEGEAEPLEYLEGIVGTAPGGVLHRSGAILRVKLKLENYKSGVRK